MTLSLLARSSSTSIVAVPSDDMRSRVAAAARADRPLTTFSGRFRPPPDLFAMDAPAVSSVVLSRPRREQKVQRAGRDIKLAARAAFRHATEEALGADDENERA